MGEIRADVTLENPGDRAVVDRGYGQESDIRRSTIDAIVDTGAVTLVLPQNVVERLGLEQRGTAFVTYADERREERPLAGPVTVQIGNRSMSTDCVVGPPLSEPSIGQVVVETRDLIADCTNRTLTPRYWLPSAAGRVPAAREMAWSYTSSFSVTASRNGIIARNSDPTFSIWCACSCRRCAMNHGRPALSSSIHLRA